MANLTEENSIAVEKVLDSDKKIIEKKLEIATSKTIIPTIVVEDVTELVVSVELKAPEIAAAVSKSEEKQPVEKKIEETPIEKTKENVIEKVEEKSTEQQPAKEVVEEAAKAEEVKPAESEVLAVVESAEKQTDLVETISVELPESKKGGRKRVAVVATPAVKVTVVAESVLKGGRPAKRKAAELVEDAEEADTAVEVEAIKPAITKKGKKEPVERQVPIKETLVAKATEPKVALLEAPLVIEGKRTRRSVQTLDLNPPTEAKEPPKKAAKKIAAVSKAVVAAVVALSKKESPAKKKSAAAKRGKKSKEIESEQEEEDDDECMDDDAEKEAEENVEPSEEEIRKTIEGIIDGANLDNITMKTVVKDVHAKYPGVDLTNKKNFIKGVVKELLSD
jgi:hypothetical protein